MEAVFEKWEAVLEWGGTRRKIVVLVIAGAALIASLLLSSPLPFDLAWIAILLCGIPILSEAIIGLITEFDIRADVLVSLALIASVAIGEDFAAGEVAFIMQLGALLEELTLEKARAGIERLVHLTPQTARLLKDGVERIVHAEEVAIDDLLRVLPGETVPVDGIITSGETSLNQSVMTGESLPVDKRAGDEVFSGTVNQFGAFEMRATRVGEDSSIQRMIRLVQSADAGKAKIVGIADRMATWVVIIALLAAALTWYFSGEIIRAVTILVVFCPCALVLATPTAVIAAIGNATRHGFLVREGDALERLARVRHIVFDKTGTLTIGTPQVIEVESVTTLYTKEEIFRLAAAAEQRSEHPLGRAIVAGYSASSPLPQVHDFRMTPGRGISAAVQLSEEKTVSVLAGNPALLAEASLLIPKEVLLSCQRQTARGCTVIYLAAEGQLAGYLVLSDTVRPESLGMIDRLKRLQLQPILATGDHESAARQIAGWLSIDEVHSDCLPEEKLSLISRLQSEGKPVCMIGDGINDAPALKTAHVGLAMGGIGSDIAMDAADIVLVEDDIKELPHLIALSRRMMTTIRINMSFSMGLNFLAIILAMTGLLGPVAGALVHNTGSVFVIAHCLVAVYRFDYRKIAR